MRTRVGVVVVMVAAIGLLVGSVAQSRQVVERPDYTSFRLFFFDHIPNHYEIEEGEPFFWGGGLDWEEGYPINDFQIVMFMDGDQVEPTHVGCTAELEPSENCRNYTYDFPNGLPAGDYEFYIAYVAPCGAWVDGFGFPWKVQSCVDDRLVMAHPELAGFKTLTVTAQP